MWFMQFAPSFFAEHKFEENNWGYSPEPGPWGTGPFKLVEGHLAFGKPSEFLVLEAYEAYWDPHYPKVERIIFDNRFLKDRDEAMRLCMESEGKLDIVTFARPLDTLKVAESPFAKVVKSKDVTLLEAWFNQRKSGSKWRDLRLRKAINHAINRKELWKYAAKGNAYNLDGLPIPPGAYGYSDNLSPYSYDTINAQNLLTEAGYPSGIEIHLITFEGLKLEAQIIAKMLKRLNMEVKISILTWGEFLGKIYAPMLDKPPEKQEWDIAIVNNHDWYAHTGATLLTWGFLERGRMRWINYDSLYEQMWEDMARIVDEKAQKEKIMQIASYLHDKCYRVAIYSPLALYTVNKEVNFVPQKWYYLRLKETSVTENHWSIRAKNN
jgi:peptide/nickel transport system substrate-binding protein